VTVGQVAAAVDDSDDDITKKRIALVHAILILWTQFQQHGIFQPCSSVILKKQIQYGVQVNIL